MPVIRILAQRFARLAAVGAVALTIASLHAATASGQMIGCETDPQSSDDPVAVDISGSQTAAAQGMVAQFYIGTQIVPGDAQSDEHPYLIVRATRFNQTSEATRYIDETVANLLDNPAPYDRVDPISADDMPAYGDATSGYSYTYSVPDFGPSDGVAILFQQGRVVYELELEGVEAPDMTVVDAVVQDMLDCAHEGCEPAVTVPDSLMGRTSG